MKFLRQNSAPLKQRPLFSSTLSTPEIHPRTAFAHPKKSRATGPRPCAPSCETIPDPWRLGKQRARSRGNKPRSARQRTLILYRLIAGETEAVAISNREPGCFLPSHPGRSSALKVRSVAATDFLPSPCCLLVASLSLRPHALQPSAACFHYLSPAQPQRRNHRP